MGGFGSGNRYHRWRDTKKSVVEDCLSIDANRWTREGILKAAVHHTGSRRWTYPSGNTFTVSCEVMTHDLGAPWVRLSYSWGRNGQAETQSDGYTVRLTTTYPRFGGLRWWFVCPLTAGGRACARRVGKLYLPRHARYFGCRRCYDLTYRSCQESHRDDWLIRAMDRDPGLDREAIKQALRRPG